VIGDALQNMPQVSLGIEAVELGSADEGVNARGALPAGICAGEEMVLAP